MATTPRYDRQQVEQAAMPGVRLTAAATPESMGAGVGAGLAQMGHDITRVQIEEKQKADAAAQTRFISEMSRVETDLLDNPQTGALNKKGHAAGPAYEPTLKAFDQRVGELAKQATSDEQRQGLERMVATTRAQIDRRLARHISGEIQSATDQDTKAAVASSVDLAGRNWQDPQRVDEEMGKQAAIYIAYSESHGLGADWLNRTLATSRSATRTSVIEQMIASGRGADAQAYLEKHRDDLTADHLADAQRKVKPAADVSIGQAAANEIWSAMGPKSDTSPVEIDKMAAQAREKFAGQPERLHAALSDLKERANEHNAAQKERGYEKSANVWKAFVGGAGLRQIMAMPEFQQMPGDQQAQVANQIESREAARASRAAANESRAAAAEQRALIKAERDPAVREQRALNFARLSDPETLARVSDNELMSNYGALGEDYFTRLVGLKNSIERAGANKAAKIIDAKIDQEDFFTVAANFGLDKNLGSADDRRKVSTQLMELRSKVENVIDAEQRQRGNKELTRPEKQEIVKRFFVDVTVNQQRTGTLFGLFDGQTSETKKLYQVRDPNAIVVPATALAEIRAKASERGLSLTPQQERDAYLRSLKPASK